MPPLKNEIHIVGDVKKLDIKPIQGYSLNPALSVLKANQILSFSTWSVVFSKQQEPRSVGTIYRDINGHPYYLPDPVLDRFDDADFPSGSAAVQFLKDEHGAVSLQIQLIFQRPRNAPPEATLLIPEVEFITLVWGDGQLDLPSPSYFSEDGESGYRFLVPIPAQSLDALVAAMKSKTVDSCIKMGMNVSYHIQGESAPPSDSRATGTNGAGETTFVPMLSPILTTRFATILQPSVLTAVLPPVAPVSTVTPLTPVPKHAVSLKPVSKTLALEIIGKKKFGLESFKFNPEMIKAFDKNKTTPPPEDVTRQKKVLNLNNKIGFTFTGQANNEQHIYHALEQEAHDEHEFSARWQYTDFGIFSPAAFPNRIYMMPHQLRLRYNPDLHLPDISPVLYMSPEDEPRVRLRLGMMPWYDLEKVTQLRDFLTLANPSAFMYPELITNFTAQGTLNLSTQFTEGITALEEEITVNFSSLLALDLDITLEFYKFVTTLLQGATGITGTLTIILPPQQGNPDDGLSVVEDVSTVTIPLNLKIKDIANPLLSFSAPPDSSTTDTRPQKVVVKNEGAHALVFTKAFPHLLYRDPNVVLPLNMFRAPVAAGLPLRLEAGEAETLEVAADDTLSESMWNSIDMVLADYSIDIDAADALQQTHDLVPPGGLTWSLTIQVPPFTVSPLPAGMENVFAVNVIVEIDGRAPMTITLTPDMPSHTLTIAPNLGDILTMDGGVDVLTYQYKTQTVLTDRMMDMTAPVRGQGSRIFVFPTTQQD